MKQSIEERTINLARYIVENKATVRSAAKTFGLSKSTVHTEGVILKDFIWKWRKSQKYSAFKYIQQIG